LTIPNPKGVFLFFFLDEKEPKNQGCGKIAKNGFVRLNPPNSPAFGVLKQRRLFSGSLHHFLSALFPRPVFSYSLRNKAFKSHRYNGYTQLSTPIPERAEGACAWAEKRAEPIVFP